jgi:hypothetical protein
MKRSFITAAVTACLCVVSAFGQAASSITKTDLSQAEVDQIVRKFTKNEALFRQALNVYAFNRYASISTVGMGGQITGTYRRDSYLTFNDGGDRFEKVLFAPISTLTELQVTAADIENLGGIDPFAIEPKVADQYRFTYLGKEKIDELSLHVFDVTPKLMPDWKKGIAKFFQGRIWVEDEGMMIVKSRGKAVPEGKERFPIVETTRAPVDGKYYFPIDSRADDELVFDSGQAVKIRLRVRYTDYRLGRTDVKIIEEEDVIDATSTPPPPAKKP